MTVSAGVKRAIGAAAITHAGVVAGDLQQVAFGPEALFVKIIYYINLLQ
jgi:hypothetical protein